MISFSFFRFKLNKLDLYKQVWQPRKGPTELAVKFLLLQWVYTYSGCI